MDINLGIKNGFNYLSNFSSELVGKIDSKISTNIPQTYMTKLFLILIIAVILYFSSKIQKTLAKVVIYIVSAIIILGIIFSF